MTVQGGPRLPLYLTTIGRARPFSNFSEFMRWSRGRSFLCWKNATVTCVARQARA
jgi:hypothetical protein